MEKSLVLYDDSGKIIQIINGDDINEPLGIPFLWVDIPWGKELICVNTESIPHMPVFNDMPKPKSQILLDKMKEIINSQSDLDNDTKNRLSDIEIAIAGLYGMEVI